MLWLSPFRQGTYLLSCHMFPSRLDMAQDWEQAQDMPSQNQGTSYVPALASLPPFPVPPPLSARVASLRQPVLLANKVQSRLITLSLRFSFQDLFELYIFSLISLHQMLWLCSPLLLLAPLSRTLLIVQGTAPPPPPLPGALPAQC